jgi:hypothetical protein
MNLPRSFLPIIDRPVDNTAMAAYQACPREYLFGMVQDRRGEGRTPPLVYGTSWHTVMQWHYRTGGDRNRVIYETTMAWEGHDDAEDYRTLDRCLLDYDRYVAFYGLPGSEKDTGKTIGFPDEPLVELAANAMIPGLLHPWAGKLDRVIDLGGLAYIEDHKTTSRLDKHYFRQFDLSNQMMGYTALGRVLFPQLNIVGVRVNVAHVLTGGTKFLREEFTYSPPRLEEWVQNMNSWYKRLARDYEMLKTGDPDAFPGHYGDNGCSRKFGMCGYHPVCSASPRLRQGILERDYKLLPWNPLEGVRDEV